MFFNKNIWHTIQVLLFLVFSFLTLKTLKSIKLGKYIHLYPNGCEAKIIFKRLNVEQTESQQK